MRCGVIRLPGSNCDQDCYHVAQTIYGCSTQYLWHAERQDLSSYDLIIIPGGFSYGDYLRVGAIARFAPIMEQVFSFGREGGLVLGICNGFQILTEMGLLPGALMVNRSLKFICDYVYLRVENNETPYTCSMEKGDILQIPIAHGEGNYTIDDKGLVELQENNQILLRYCNEKGEVTQKSNPNGSVDNIAGICNRERNVFGLMPHPERCAEAVLGNGSLDGKKIFDSLLEEVVSNA